MTITEQDKKFIRQCFELARKGEGLVSPNPMVGAVIVKNGKVISTGYHQKYGSVHAERDAILKLAGKNPVKNCAFDCSLYVSLEPCNHEGKTPPCTDIIIESGIKKVYFSIRDPHPLVAQQDSVKILEKTGIKVFFPILEKEGQVLNKIFLKNVQKNEPYFILKTALTADGKITAPPGQGKWITGPQAREYVQRLRYSVDAVLVGVNTVLKDDPRLTVRLPGQNKNILRLILDTNGRTPQTAKIIKNNTDKKTMLVVSEDLPEKKLTELKKLKVSLLLAPVDKKTGQIDLVKLSKILFKLSICSVLVEGGAQVNTTFLKSGLLDEYYWFIAPQTSGASSKNNLLNSGLENISKKTKLRPVAIEKLGPDLLIHGYFK